MASSGALPGLFLERMTRICGEDGAEAVSRSLCVPRPLSFRVLGASGTEDVIAELDHAGFSLESIPWSAGACLAHGGTRRQLQETDAWARGRLFIQSLSSMAAAEALDVAAGLHVLDLCAAPGGKTAILGLRQQGHGVLLANDRSRTRLGSLRSVLGQHGITHAEFSCRPGESFGGTHRSCFDRVLVDAPCSGEGMLRSDDQAGCAQWSMGRIRRLARQQERLLIAGLRCLRPGGVLVYATCTYAPEENESVLHRVLLKIDVPVEIEAIPEGLPLGCPGLASWEGQEFHPGVTSARRLLPDGRCEGFFMARFRRLS